MVRKALRSGIMIQYFIVEIFDDIFSATMAAHSLDVRPSAVKNPAC